MLMIIAKILTTVPKSVPKVLRVLVPIEQLF